MTGSPTSPYAATSSPTGSSTTGSYVEGTTHTNTIEGFGNLKTGMRGAYKKVSPAYLQSYLNEYTWRYNARQDSRPRFAQLLSRAAAR